MRSLMSFDRKVFRPDDRFPSVYWRHVISYWMLVDEVKVGCCAFETNVDFQQDQREDDRNPPMSGSLYIASTAILPKYQRRGFGRLLKSWQLAFALRHRFHRIVTNTRERNEAMIHLNRKFGFDVIRVTPDYYSKPNDATVVMELLLRKSTVPNRSRG